MGCGWRVHQQCRFHALNLPQDVRTLRPGRVRRRGARHVRVDQRILLYALSLGGGGLLLLLLCMCAVFRCLYALSTGDMHGPGDALMRQRWQRAHAAPSPGMQAVHVPVREDLHLHRTDENITF